MPKKKFGMGKNHIFGFKSLIFFSHSKRGGNLKKNPNLLNGKKPKRCLIFFFVQTGAFFPKRGGVI